MSNDAGSLKNRIVIEYSEEQKESDYGGIKVTPRVFASRWAEIKTTGGRESFRAMQVNPLLTHRVKIRWLRGVNSKMRIRFDDPKDDRTRYFNIDRVDDEDQRPVWLFLYCIEEVET